MGGELVATKDAASGEPKDTAGATDVASAVPNAEGATVGFGTLKVEAETEGPVLVGVTVALEGAGAVGVAACWDFRTA